MPIPFWPYMSRPLKGIRRQGCKTPTDRTVVQECRAWQTSLCTVWTDYKKPHDSMPHYCIWIGECLQLHGIIEYSESLHTKHHGRPTLSPTSRILLKSPSNSQIMTQGDPSPPDIVPALLNDCPWQGPPTPFVDHYTDNSFNLLQPGSLSASVVQRELYWMKDVQISGCRILVLCR